MLVEMLAAQKKDKSLLGLALQKAIAQIDDEILAPAATIKAMEGEFRAMGTNLQPQARALYGVLAEISRAEQLGVGLEFADAILEELRSVESIKADLEAMGNNPDMEILAQAHALCIQIENAEA
jgi:hypothetical protein